ncbi:early endosome antigen 1-like [Procambarus clarkii]|uniref:early endosome antigen 1-like n=1 Tax=Procambarus clarkii TaxID=6728 RepID=UPI0037431897
MQMERQMDGKTANEMKEFIAGKFVDETEQFVPPKKELDEKLLSKQAKALTENDKEVCEELNERFHVLQQCMETKLQYEKPEEILDGIVVTVKEVKKVLWELDVTKINGAKPNLTIAAEGGCRSTFTPFRNDPAGEVGNLSHAYRAELQTLAHEYQLGAPPGANKNDLHNLILDYLLDEGITDSDVHENYSIADEHALAAMKLKLEQANIEREQQKKEELEREAALKKEQQERELALKKKEAALHRERERKQLAAKKLHREMQCEHDKQQAESVLAYHRQELTLETTHHTQCQQATTSLPVSFNVSHAKISPQLATLLNEDIEGRRERNSSNFLSDRQDSGEVIVKRLSTTKVAERRIEIMTQLTAREETTGEELSQEGLSQGEPSQVEPSQAPTSVARIHSERANSGGSIEANREVELRHVERGLVSIPARRDDRKARERDLSTFDPLEAEAFFDHFERIATLKE